MNNILSVFLVIAALVIGSFAGAFLFPNEVEVEVPGDCDACPTCEVCPDIDVETPLDLRDQAFEDFWAYLDDEDKFICSDKEYDEDEVSLSKMYDEFSIEYDGDEYTVDFSAKLKFKESDLRSCRETFDVSVYYEEGEDPEVTFE